MSDILSTAAAPLLSCSFPCSPIKHLAQQPPTENKAWPFYVGSKYPYIGNQPNPSPLPTFAKTGLNTWPYPDFPHFVLGQVALTAKLEKPTANIV